MTNTLLQIGISNLVLSIVLALAAYVVHRTGKLPLVAHLLWVLVLVKLVTPPLVTLPLIPVPRQASTATAEAPFEFNAAEAIALESMESGDAMVAVATPSSQLIANGLLLAWLLGSGVVFVWSLLRVQRFNRLLHAASQLAPPALQRQAARIAARLGLKSAPTIYATSAQLSPMVWWVGRRVRVIIPTDLIQSMGPDQMRWVLAHELGHVRRRDYLVRWLEWLACVTFWWNPVAWLARRNLRINEEICCDALVLSALEPQPQTYANALMDVVEFLASPVIRPPAMASEITSGGFLERRFRMIMSKERLTKTPRGLVAGILALTFCLLPLGVAYGQDYDAVQKRLGKAVGRGEITLGQANAMMAALKKSAAEKKPAIIVEGVKAKALSKADAEKAAIKIKNAVEAGQLSKEEANKKLVAIKKMVAEQAARSEREVVGRKATERAVLEIRKAAEAGKITTEQAQAKLKAIKVAGTNGVIEVQGRAIQGVSREQAERAVLEIRRAVEAGKVSAEDARTKLEVIKKKLAEQPQKQSDVDWAAIKKRIEGAVEDGRMTREQADAAYGAIKKQMAEGSGR